MTLIDYTSRKEGEGGLASIEDNINASIQRLEDYIEKRGRESITTTRKKHTNNTKTEQNENNQKTNMENKIIL